MGISRETSKESQFHIERFVIRIEAQLQDQPASRGAQECDSQVAQPRTGIALPLQMSPDRLVSHEKENLHLGDAARELACHSPSAACFPALWYDLTRNNAARSHSALSTKRRSSPRRGPSPAYLRAALFGNGKPLPA